MERSRAVEEILQKIESVLKLSVEHDLGNVFDNYNFRTLSIFSSLEKNKIFDNLEVSTKRTGKDAWAEGFDNIEIKTNLLKTLSITENCMEMQFDKQNDFLRRAETVNYNAFVSSLFEETGVSPLLTVVFKSEKAMGLMNDKIKQEQQKFVKGLEASTSQGKRKRDNISIKPLKVLKEVEEEDVIILFKGEVISLGDFRKNILGRKVIEL